MGDPGQGGGVAAAEGWVRREWGVGEADQKGAGVEVREDDEKVCDVVQRRSARLWLSRAPPPAARGAPGGGGARGARERRRARPRVAYSSQGSQIGK